MNLLLDPWLRGVDQQGRIRPMSVPEIGEAGWHDLHAERPDFRGAVYEGLIGLLQILPLAQGVDDWRRRYDNPPGAEELTAMLAPVKHAFLLQNDGPAFMQDLNLPDDANELCVQGLLIDAGSDSNVFFNKEPADFGLCESCAAQALLALQLNAPPGGRGIRTSVRGGGPLTTLLVPVADNASLWQKLWLNVLPADALNYPPVDDWADVFPWLAPTRTSDGPGARDTTPEDVHPLQAWWSTSRRYRLDASTVDEGACSVCGVQASRRFRRYRARHGGVNYTGAWKHPLTPYFLDPKGESPPISCKGQHGGRGYRDWLSFTLGNDDHQPDAAQVVSHYTAKLNHTPVRLWCFGYHMSNMKALCWYDSMLPVHVVDADIRLAFTRQVKQVLDSAQAMASALHKQVKSAWFRRPGEVGQEPAIPQSFWQGSEVIFYRVLESLAKLDFDSEAELVPIYRQWLQQTRVLALSLFDHWVLSGPVEEQDMKRVTQARAGLARELNSGKAMKPLWEAINRYDKELA